MSYRTSPSDLEGLPPGVPHIIGNEAAERFSFYGMKAVLAVFMVQYLHLMDGRSGSVMNEAEATAQVHLFNGAVYLTPFLGALLADVFVGKFRTIIALSLVYCAGHAALACMGVFGNSPWWLMAGLGLIALGSGGIKPCVSAHVGDQFGIRNAHLLPRIFNGFYFSVNTGAFASMLLTPWLLEWYGPHLAFGVPGLLMLLATVVFWMGRHRFIHVPAGGMRFVRELFKGGGLAALLKLLPLYLFVAMFWALFDQTGSTWIFQSYDMDRRFLGFEWLPSQIQSLNSVFVLVFIPIFAYIIYPAVDRVWKLTPLRKIGLGLFIMVTSFALVAVIQQWIDHGQKPSISWQILAFALLTVSEVMVSIVAMEFAYTQAPKTMKSLLMCYYLGSVAIGNFFVAGVNHFIQIPDSASTQLTKAVAQIPTDKRKEPRSIVLPGYDGTTISSNR
jgi:POT family proton-dependent oligopeptide transporter